MSRVRRPIAARKRPAPKPGVVPPAVPVMPGSVSDESVVAASGPVAEDVREKLLEEIHEQLLGQPSIDGNEIDEVMEHFRAAIRDASLEPSATPLDISSWIEVLEQTVLADQDPSEEDERNALLRQIADLKDSLENDDLQIALEYVRRLQEHGEEEAVAWLASRHAERETAKVSAQVNEQGMDAIAPHSVTRSRSRRLRGPPR